MPVLAHSRGAGLREAAGGTDEEKKEVQEHTTGMHDAHTSPVKTDEATGWKPNDKGYQKTARWSRQSKVRTEFRKTNVFAVRFSFFFFFAVLFPAWLSLYFIYTTTAKRRSCPAYGTHKSTTGKSDTPLSEARREEDTGSHTHLLTCNVLEVLFIRSHATRFLLPCGAPVLAPVNK